jgi:hypothetical protein
MSRPRLISAARDLGGDERRQKVISYLKTAFEVIEVRAHMPRSARLLNLLATASPNKERWRERSKKNAFFFRHTSTAVRRRLADVSRPGDVVLVFEALFSPGLGSNRFQPYVIYEDGTSQMARQRWPRWVPDTATTDQYVQLETEHYQNAARILTTNEATRESLLNDYAIRPAKVVNVGQGHDFGEVNLTARRPAPASILFVGYEFERKGGRILLEAFRRVRRLIPDAT